MLNIDNTVMAGLDPAIHACFQRVDGQKDVDTRVKPAHDAKLYRIDLKRLIFKRTLKVAGTALTRYPVTFRLWQGRLCLRF